MSLSDDETEDPLSARAIKERYAELVGKLKNKDENRNWNRQFPREFRISPSKLTQDSHGVHMLDNVATEMIEKGKVLFGTKYRERAVLLRGETFGWNQRETQNQTYRMLIYC